MKSRLIRLGTLSVIAAVAANAASLFLSPSALAGMPGETVGWGFTIQSTPITDGVSQITPWLFITSADFVPDIGSDPVGVFTSYITQLPNSNTVIGPDAGAGEISPWTQSFDPGMLTGIGEYDINDFQSPGDQVSGSIVLTYDEYRLSPNDPCFKPYKDTIATGLTMSALASVSVFGPDAPVPEPGTFLLAGIVLVFGAARLRRWNVRKRLGI